MKLKDSFLSLIKGGILGIASLVPGVSLGSNLLAVGVYEHITEAISNLFKKNNKKLFLVVIPLIIGLTAGTLAGFKLVRYCIENFQMPTIFLFVGFLFGALKLIAKKKDNIFSWKNVIITIGCGLLLFCIQFFLFENIALSNFQNILGVVLLSFMTGLFIFVPSFSGLDAIFSAVFKLSSPLETLLFFIILILIIIALAKILYFLISKKTLAMYLFLSGGLIASIINLLFKVNFTFDFVNIFTSILAFLWGYILVKNLEKE